MGKGLAFWEDLWETTEGRAGAFVDIDSPRSRENDRINSIAKENVNILRNLGGTIDTSGRHRNEFGKLTGIYTDDINQLRTNYMLRTRFYPQENTCG